LIERKIKVVQQSLRKKVMPISLEYRILFFWCWSSFLNWWELQKIKVIKKEGRERKRKEREIKTRKNKETFKTYS